RRPRGRRTPGPARRPPGARQGARPGRPARRGPGPFGPADPPARGSLVRGHESSDPAAGRLALRAVPVPNRDDRDPRDRTQVAALMALNRVFGDCYDVSADEVADPQAFEERWPKDQFIFDVQTHHVDVGRKFYDDTPTGRGIKSFFLSLRPQAKDPAQALEL